MSDTLLVMNAGSSSIKFCLYTLEDSTFATPLFRGHLERIGTPDPHLSIRQTTGGLRVNQGIAATQAADIASAQQIINTWLNDALPTAPLAVGHRIVHGGPLFSQSVRVDPSLLQQLEAFIPLAPLHQGNNLAPIRAIHARWPDTLQVACFDTAFHRGHSDVADRYAIPDTLYQQGIRRYGFHGLSYEYITQHLRQTLPALYDRKLVVAHLGAGASACAIHHGQSVDSTMGFTALDGLPMATRPGQLDPGILLWMMQRGMTHAQIEHLLYHECGMQGLSGLSHDMRTLLMSEAPSAKLALAYYAWRVAQSIAGLGCAMNGIDALIFTAGVGENAAPIRAAICTHCAWLGITLDAARNAHHAPCITRPDSRIPVYVIPTDEASIIAQHTWHQLRQT